MHEMAKERKEKIDGSINIFGMMIVILTF